MTQSISYVIGHSLILHYLLDPYLLPFQPRVCPVRYHNQCHIPFQRLRAQNEQPSEGKPEKSVYGSRLIHTAAPKVGPHARACAHTRPRHRRGVGEKPHVRGSVERTASLAVAKTGAAVAKQGRLAT